MKGQMLGIFVFVVIAITMGAMMVITTDFSDIEATVKVQEVGTRYAMINWGEQHYIRIQNVFSEQFASSSESWETCITKDQVDRFKKVKNDKEIVNIRVKGHGLSTIFKCITGDRVVE